MRASLFIQKTNEGDEIKEKRNKRTKKCTEEHGWENKKGETNNESRTLELASNGRRHESYASVGIAIYPPNGVCFRFTQYKKKMTAICNAQNFNVWMGCGRKQRREEDREQMLPT